MAEELSILGWKLRTFPGEDEPRMSEDDLARRLGTVRRNVRRTISRLKESGILKDSNTYSEVSESSGPGPKTTETFWLDEFGAIQVAMDSQGDAARKLRCDVVAVFIAYRRGQLVPASIVSTDPAALMTFVLTAVNKQTTLIERWLSKPEPAEPESELWISKDQRRHLQSQARALGKLTDRNLTQVWHAVCDDIGEVGKTGKAFAGVTRQRFDVVSEHLRQLYMAARINRDEADQDETSPTMVRPEPQFIETINGGGPVSRDWKQEGDVGMADVLSRVKAEGLVGEAAPLKNLFAVYEYLERQRLIHPRIEMTPAHSKLGPNARPLLFLSPSDVEVFLKFVRQEAHRKSNGGAPRGRVVPDSV